MAVKTTTKKETARAKRKASQSGIVPTVTNRVIIRKPGQGGGKKNG